MRGVERYLVVLTLFLSSLLSFGQRFNEAYEPQASLGGPGVGIVVGDDSTLVIAARTVYLSTLSDGLALFAINSNDGSMLWESSFAFGNAMSLGKSGSLIKTLDGGYAGTGAYGVGSLFEVLFVRWNAQGDTVLTRHFSTGHNCRGITLHQIQPNKYLIIGDREATSSAAARITVWAVDSLGNLLWEENVNSNSGNERVRGTCEFPNGDIFISSSNTADIVRGVRIDENGNVVWNRLFNDYDVMHCSYADTGLICLSYRGDNNGNITPYIQHVSDSGYVGFGTLLNQQYQAGGSGHDPFLDENGDVYGLGTKLSGGQQGYMRKIRQDGTVVWERTYTKGTGTHYVWDATPTPDSGYAFTGSTNLNTQAVWVVKVDRDGCEVPLCNISLEEHDETELKFYPNPASDWLDVEFPSSGLHSIEIADVLGRVVLQQQVSGIHSQLDLSHLSPGTYILQARNQSGRQWIDKVVIE